jgi:hypothetical protein
LAGGGATASVESQLSVDRRSFLYGSVLMLAAPFAVEAPQAGEVQALRVQGAFADHFFTLSAQAGSALARWR